MTKIILNKQQQQAVVFLSGPILILAGAGAGKTLTLTARILKLIESGIMPQNILAITFSNKAAEEMRKRILSAILKNTKINFPVLEQGMKPFIATFHALGVFIIRENYQILKISKYFSIYDRADTRRALKESIKQLNLDPKNWDLKMLISIISKNKGNFIDNIKFQNISKNIPQNNNNNNNNNNDIVRIWNKYEKIKEEDKALDFDDLLLKTAQLLENNNEIRNHYLKKWSYLHIDEYQDTNKVQNKIAIFLTNPKTKNIFVVGDDDQSIYEWRGSKIENILSFEKKYKAKKIYLEQNYRSTANIIKASNSVIVKNSGRYPKKLFTESPAGEKITLHSAYSEKEEAKYITSEIKKKIKKQKKLNENDIAILYRANFQSRILEEAMLKEDIPYYVLGTKFFDRVEVKIIMSYIKFSQNNTSLVDLKRIINFPKRGIGEASIVKIFADKIDSLTLKTKLKYENFLKNIKKINKFSKKNTISELVKFTIVESGLEKHFNEQKTEESMERLANVYELSVFAEKYDYLGVEEGLLKFLEDVALISDTDNTENKDKKPRVKLMTIHTSKGLEFDTVFLTGAEESLFSSINNNIEIKQKLEEERRLFYVAMTRAKNKLYISWADIRTIYGLTKQNDLCPFVGDIPLDVIKEESLFNSIKKDDNDIEFLEW